MPLPDEDVILGTEDDIDIHPGVLSYDISLHDLNVRLKRSIRVPTSRVRCRRNAPRSGLGAITRKNNNNTVRETQHAVSSAEPRVIPEPRVVRNIGGGVTKGTVMINPESGGAANMVFDTGGQQFGPGRPENGHGDKANKKTALLGLEASHQGKEAKDSWRSTHPGTASFGSLAKDKHHGSGKDQPNDLGSCMKCSGKEAAVQCSCKMVRTC